MDPENKVLLNIVCNTRLCQSIWSLVGKHRKRVGFRHVYTPLCNIITILCFTRSGEIIQQVAKVWRSMGAVLCEQMCPLKLVSMLQIWTWEARTWEKLLSSVTSAWSSSQGGKWLYNQVSDMSPQSVHRHHNTARIVSYGCFLLFIYSRGQIPGQGFWGQMDD